MRAARLGPPPAREGEGNLPPFFNPPARVLPPPGSSRGSAGSGRAPPRPAMAPLLGRKPFPLAKPLPPGEPGERFVIPHTQEAFRTREYPLGPGARGDGAAGMGGRLCQRRCCHLPRPPLPGRAGSPLLGAEPASAAAAALLGGGGAEQSGAGGRGAGPLGSSGAASLREGPGRRRRLRPARERTRPCGRGRLFPDKFLSRFKARFQADGRRGGRRGDGGSARAGAARPWREANG